MSWKVFEHYRKAFSLSVRACCCINSLSENIKGLPPPGYFALALNMARERLWKGSPLHCLELFVSSVSLWFHPGTQQLPCPPTNSPEHQHEKKKKSSSFAWPCIPWDQVISQYFTWTMINKCEIYQFHISFGWQKNYHDFTWEPLVHFRKKSAFVLSALSHDLR